MLKDPVEDIVADLRGGRSALRKLVLEASTLRREAILDLYNMNITYESLFPGLDGLARSLNLELEI